MFIDGHKRPDIIEDFRVFLNKIEKLKSYIVEFDKNGAIKLKTYPLNYAVGGNYWQPIIIITYNKYTFFANDGI